MVEPYPIERTEAMSFGEAIQTVFRKYAEFMGRAARAEFWWWALFNLLVASALNFFNVIRIGDNAYLGSLLAGLWGSRSCCRASPWPSDDCATPATAGAACSFLVPVAGIFVLITLWVQPTKPAAPATATA